MVPFRIVHMVYYSRSFRSRNPLFGLLAFSAALLKKSCEATKGMTNSNVTGRGTTAADGSYGDPKPTVTETALVVAFKKFSRWF
ncbi:hypothetical protein OPV22_032309 [Ensete ventricosum]|uniref:Secreted protein n=1 Tax=Ensete ventricosum TaxID=4639 RepID=A0AAV8PR73_ENSVE|nr:hypothetical protein OPV22_032309 [Ensete ventricosum]